MHVDRDHILAGSLDGFTGDDAIAVGIGLAQRLGLGVGSRLTLISPQGAATVFGNMPRIRAYRVVAIFEAGFNEYNTSFVFLPLDAAQIYFQHARRRHADRGDHRRPGPRARGRRAPSAPRSAGAPVRVIDWTQSNNSFFAAVEVERNVMFLILTLIILVAAFNVVSSLIMMVKDKTRDIAVLRTLGAGSGAIMRIFLMCGACVGVAGTLAGTLLGVVFCRNIETHPALARRV